jgi:hypothetical protein
VLGSCNIKETSLKLHVPPSFSSISLHDLLCATRDGFKS